MDLVVASKTESNAEELRRWMLQDGLRGNVLWLPIDEVADRVSRYRPEAVVLWETDSPDRLLSLVAHVQETIPSRILVVGPAAEAKLILDILREGAFQYIDREEVASQIGPALRRMRQQPAPASTCGRLISVVGVGGGNGASTLAANLAVDLARKYEACALCDLSVSSGDLAALLDLHPIHCVADLCRHVERVDKSLFLHSLTKHATGVHLLAAPQSYRDLRDITARGVRKAIGLARSHFSYVIVDHDSPYRAEQLQVLQQADTILLVIRLDIAAVRRAQDLIAFLKETRIEPSRLRLIVSRYRRPGELRIADVEKALELRASQVIPEDARIVNRANNRGVPVILDQPRAGVSRSILELSHSVNGRLGQGTVSALVAGNS